MSVYAGSLDDVSVVGVEGFSYRVRERAGELPRIFMRKSAGVEERYLEDVSPGVVRPGMLIAKNRLVVPLWCIAPLREISL